jgi:hypothetical protein
MLRHTVIAFVFSMLPASALACGMYIPPENDKLLADILEEIDSSANKEALAAQQAQAAQQNQAQPQPAAPAAEPAPAEAPAPTVIPEVAAVTPKS